MHFVYSFQLANRYPAPQLETLLLQNPGLALKRLTINSNGNTFCMCLSSESNDTGYIQATVSKILIENGYTLTGKMEMETVADEPIKGSHCNHHDHSHDENENHWAKAALGLLWGLGLILLSLSGLALPGAVTLLTTGVTGYLGFKIYKSAWQSLREHYWDSSTLYAISTLTIVIASLISLFIPGIPLMVEAAPFVLGFWHLGEAIEERLLAEIDNDLDVRDCVSPTARLKSYDYRVIPVNELIPHDVILIQAGEVIPVDGVLLSDKAVLYTTRVNGSAYPHTFSADDELLSGMCLAKNHPTIEMRVSKTYQNSYLSQIAKNINQAQNKKAPIQIFADKVLYYFIPSVLAIALLSGVVIASLFNFGLAIQCVASVLVSVCPCALRIITPLSLEIGMKKAADHGIHFKNGAALQATADIDTVVFDLNGTLTQGKIEVQSLRINDPNDLACIHALESQSDHAIAKVIQSYIKQQGSVSRTPIAVTHLETNHHSGIKGRINNQDYIIGSKDILAAHGIMQFPVPYDNPENGNIYIAKAGTVIGQIALTDPLRADAFATVKYLQSIGKTVHLCSGSDKATVEKYADLLGINRKNICANAVAITSKPGQVSKSAYIQQLQNQSCKVAMIGDAINDLQAIELADIGIAVKSKIGDSITEKYAGIVVQKGLLFPIATAFEVAEKTKTSIYQNLFISLSYNSSITLVAAGLFVAVSFSLSPAAGMFMTVLESSLVLGNLYRFKNQSCTTAENYKAKQTTSSSTAQLLNALGYNPQAQQPVDNFENKSDIYQPIWTKPVELDIHYPTTLTC